jgi:hypothetical protein
VVTLPKKARSDNMVNGESLAERIGKLEQRIGKPDWFARGISIAAWLDDNAEYLQQLKTL